MQEIVQQAYWELVQALINCPQGQEQELLAEKPELVNENLVQILLEAAQILTEREGQEATSTVHWLVDFAQDLAEQLGITLVFEEDAGEISNEPEEQLQFLLEVLQSVSDSNGNFQVVYPLLQKNLRLLNDDIVAVLRAWVSSTFAKVEEDKKRSITTDIGNFSDLICDFPLGNKAVNVELSIAGYEIILEMFAATKEPEIWPQFQNNLAIAYQNRILGDKAQNLEAAIAGYAAALEIYTKQDSPIQWASTQNNLAFVLTERILGDKAQNLEMAIAGCAAALEIYTKHDFPIQWAATQNHLAIAYGKRILGDKAQNLKAAIASYDAALEIRTKENSPIDWAATQNNLGLTLSNPIESKVQNIERGILAYTAALEIRTKESFPIQWAETQNSLASAYLNRTMGDRAENLEKAIAGYALALEIRTKENFPIDWAATQNNLAFTYSKRILGDRAENLEKAIAGCASALEIRTKENFPIDWADTQNNLSIAYSYRILGDRAENLEKAITGYASALEIRTKENFPIGWAATQNNCAAAYSERILGDRAQNMEDAIAGYTAALEVYTKQDSPINWAATQNNLALAYSERILGDRAQNIEKTLAGYASALEIRTEQNFPIEWAETQSNIAYLYIKIDSDRAIYHFQQSLQIFQVNILPINCLRDSRRLGNIYLMQSKWSHAVAVYEVAMKAAELSRSWSVDDSERQRVLRDALSVYENAIQCAVNLKKYQRAIEYTERVRSRQLVELMASKALYSDAQFPAQIQAYLAEYQQLNLSIENLRGDSTKMLATSNNRDSENLRKSSEQIQQAEARKQFLYRQIRTYDPVLAGQIEVVAISYSDIQKLITNAHTAILAFYSTDNDTHIFILKHNQEPELFTMPTQGKQALQQWLIENWLIPYQEDNFNWLEQMPTVLAELADRLQINQLIANHLAGIQELVLVPHLLLHQIPFAALPIKGSPAMLGEKFVVRFIPSCQILQYCQQRPEITTTIQGLVEDADETLIGARYEGHKIAEICEVKEGDRLRGKTQATVANYRLLLGRVNRLHSSHHAASRWDNPLESALKLGDGNITLGDLLLGERYPSLDEVFLSACETHVGQFTLTDDVATITTGFLCAGARSVQSTLWSVSDLVTAIFDIFYHQERQEGYNRAVSLKRAQVRLKNLSGEEFKINHYSDLIAFIEKDDHLKTTLAAIEQQILELEDLKAVIISSEELEEFTITISRLYKQYEALEKLPKTLEQYGQQAKPFSAPYYWAGFVCQGMA
jgi:CHAT domain-containing protein/tetratricopeptide (TPR) repeat protein